MTAERIEKIRQCIEDAVAPSELRIKDQSHLHAGHAGAEAGMGHFDVFVRSNAFEGVRTLKRHQMIYAAVGDLMKTDVHALAIRALAPDE